METYIEGDHNFINQATNANNTKVHTMSQLNT